MSRAGFVLAGGRSSRMGRDKALLEVRGATLLARTAAAVADAAGGVTLVGDPAKYAGLGYPVVADTFPGCGPLAGIHAALAATTADWNLVVACDMPELSASFLAHLLEKAAAAGADCLLPAGASGRPEPLCAVYHRRARAAIERALENGVRKVLDGLAGLRVEIYRLHDPGPFRNLNTPEEWSEYLRAQEDKTPRGRD